MRPITTRYFRLRGVLLVLVLLPLIALSAPAAVRAAPNSDGNVVPALPDTCEEGVLPSGALWLICIPDSDWNGDMVLFGHGYTAFNEPLGFQNLYFGDIYLPDLIQSLGYGFATTSYRQNGLAMLEGVQDMRELIAAIPAVAGQVPEHTFMTGASEGGIVGTLLAERYPELIDGALAVCGPVGNFRWQLSYLGDGRVLFDYFFPGVLPGDPFQIPNFVINNWDTVYEPAVQQAIASDPVAALEVVRTANAAYEPGDFSTIQNTIETFAWYSVFATNDGKEKLNGNPFGNLRRIYRGSQNDLHLNRNVYRTAADLSTLTTVPQYQTTGDLSIPVVNVHTTLDEQVPYWNQLLYRQKVRAAGASEYLTTIPISRYGHCNLTPAEVLGSFALLVFQATGEVPPGLTMIDPVQAEQDTLAAEANVVIPDYE